jgi:hypothetical protein
VLLRGLNPLIATVGTPDAAPVVAATHMRAGNAASVRGAASLVAEAIVTAEAVTAQRSGRPGGEIVVRADPALYVRKVIAVRRRARVRFSVTVRIDTKVRTAIEAIGDGAWVEIAYPQPIWDDQQRWGLRAQIAETAYTAFAGTRDAVTQGARLPQIRQRPEHINRPAATARQTLRPQPRVPGQPRITDPGTDHCQPRDTSRHLPRPHPGPTAAFRFGPDPGAQPTGAGQSTAGRLPTTAARPAPPCGERGIEPSCSGQARSRRHRPTATSTLGRTRRHGRWPCSRSRRLRRATPR